MPWRIRTQTVILSFVPLFFLCLLFVLALVMVNRTLDVASLTQRSAQVITINDLAMRSISQMGTSLNAFGTSHKAMALAGYRAGSEALPAQLRELQRLTAGEPGQQKPVAKYVADLNYSIFVLREYEQYLRLRQASKIKALSADPDVKRLGLALSVESGDISAVQRTIALQILDRARRAQQTFGILLILCCLAGIVFTLGTSLAYGLRFVRRLHDLATNAQLMAAGAEPVPIGGSDEISELNNVYLEMTRRIQKEHQIASTLQRALLPGDLPLVDGLRIDTAYTPATSEIAVGGDWYDVFVLSETRVGISVGDVAGHGLRAAGVMGTTRQAIRTVAGIDGDPGRVLAHVNRALIRNEKDWLVTAFFGTLDLETGELCYAVAGHPAPMFVRADGAIEQSAACGMILGVDGLARFETHQTFFEAGTGLILYTDGIVEVERDYLKGVRDLEEAVRVEFDGAASNIAESIQRRIFARVEPRDDSAVLVVRVLSLRAGTLEPKVWSVDTKVPESARRVKRSVLEELARTAVGVDFSGSELILGELLSNVARHTPGSAEVTLEWKNGDAILHVLDRGAPFEFGHPAIPDTLAENGRGLFLVTSVARGITVEQTPMGNRVTAILPANAS